MGVLIEEVLYYASSDFDRTRAGPKRLAYVRHQPLSNWNLIRRLQ
jgi:hypothetical protein